VTLTWPPDLRVGGGREKEEEEEEGKGGQKNKRQVRGGHLGPGLLTCWRAGGEKKKKEKKKKERRGERRKGSYVGFICVSVCEMARRQAPIFFKCALKKKKPARVPGFFLYCP
jgi:hypothetical protein